LCAQHRIIDGGRPATLTGPTLTSQVTNSGWSIRARTALRDRLELFIAYAEYVRVCAAHEIIDEDAFDALLGLLHTRGLVLHYANDPSLWDVVVLQPEWLTSAISQVLDDDETRRADGVLEHVRVVKIWQVGRTASPTPIGSAATCSG